MRPLAFSISLTTSRCIRSNAQYVNVFFTLAEGRILIILSTLYAIPSLKYYKIILIHATVIRSYLKKRNLLPVEMIYIVSARSNGKEKFHFQHDSRSDGHLKFGQISNELANAISVHTECSLRNKLTSCLP